MNEHIDLIAVCTRISFLLKKLGYESPETGERNGIAFLKILTALEDMESRVTKLQDELDVANKEIARMEEHGP